MRSVRFLQWSCALLAGLVVGGTVEPVRPVIAVDGPGTQSGGPTPEEMERTRRQAHALFLYFGLIPSARIRELEYTEYQFYVRAEAALCGGDYTDFTFVAKNLATGGEKSSYSTGPWNVGYTPSGAGYYPSAGLEAGFSLPPGQYEIRIREQPEVRFTAQVRRSEEVFQVGGGETLMARWSVEGQAWGRPTDPKEPIWHQEVKSDLEFSQEQRRMFRSALDYRRRAQLPDLAPRWTPAAAELWDLLLSYGIGDRMADEFRYTEEIFGRESSDWGMGKADALYVVIINPKAPWLGGGPFIQTRTSKLDRNGRLPRDNDVIKADIAHEIWHAYRNQVLKKWGRDSETRNAFAGTVAWLGNQWVQPVEALGAWIPARSAIKDWNDFTDEYVADIVDELVASYARIKLAVSRGNRSPDEARRGWQRVLEGAMSRTYNAYENTGFRTEYKVRCPPPPGLIRRLVELLGLTDVAGPIRSTRSWPYPGADPATAPQAAPRPQGATHFGGGGGGAVGGAPRTPTPPQPPGPPPAPPPGGTVFFDDTFRNADWELAATFTSGPGGTASAAQVTSGGNSGDQRQNTHVLNAAPTGSAQVFSFHRRIGATHQPGTQGAIGAVDYSEDSLFVSGHDQATFPAVRQNGKIYRCTCSGPVSSTSSGWVRHEFRSLTAASFFEIGAGVVENPNQNPNFSSTGSAIDFGYIRGTSHLGPVSSTRVAGIDNWRVVISPQTGPTLTPTPTASPIPTSTPLPGNLVVNGGFEEPAIPNGTFRVLLPSDTIPGWRTTSACGLELQAGVAGAPAEGRQLVELDALCSSSVFQDLATMAGQSYRLRFAFSPRPNTADNRLEVRWGGSVVTTLSANGTGLTDTNWARHEFTVTAAGTATRLEFREVGLSDSFGTYLDDVSVR